MLSAVSLLHKEACYFAPLSLDDGVDIVRDKYLFA